MSKSARLAAVILTTAFVAGLANAQAATRIFFEDFEGSNDSWKTNMRPGDPSFLDDYVARVSNNPHSGNWSVRGNAMNGRVDPITNLMGNGMHTLEPRFGTNTHPTPNGLFIRYWRRLDHAYWAQPSDHGKGEFIIDQQFAQRAFYTRNAWSANNFFLGDNGAAWTNPTGSEWYNGDGRLNRYGTGVAYLQGPSTFSPTMGAADGQWHKYEFYFDYINHTLQMWVDGVAITAYGSSVGYFTDRIPIHPSFRCVGLWLLYVGTDGTEGSTDGQGYACGYQYDDLEAWDGLPPDFGADLGAPGQPGQPVRQ